jgi:hypothetical protein
MTSEIGVNELSQELKSQWPIFGVWPSAPRVICLLLLKYGAYANENQRGSIAAIGTEPEKRDPTRNVCSVSLVGQEPFVQLESGTPL